ncbi:hypothetical protein SASPL_147934 [Salvia splendens]|uniref:Uncharacterized protein n=1 Tax=Salvia splendens TaxID=180675 RepID=A0A8X8Z764_SALSN|nr:hypothetical protein SASPL_147934 [Salvia splendens]
MDLKRLEDEEMILWHDFVLKESGGTSFTKLGDISPPRGVKAAMEMQRMRRAQVLESEGEVVREKLSLKIAMDMWLWCKIALVSFIQIAAAQPLSDLSRQIGSVCHSKLVNPSTKAVSRAYDRHRSKVSSKQRVLNFLLVGGDCVLVGLQVSFHMVLSQ